MFDLMSAALRLDGPETSLTRNGREVPGDTEKFERKFAETIKSYEIYVPTNANKVQGISGAKTRLAPGTPFRSKFSQCQAKRAAMFQRQIQEQMAKIKGHGTSGHQRLQHFLLDSCFSMLFCSCFPLLCFSSFSVVLLICMYIYVYVCIYLHIHLHRSTTMIL